MRKNKLGLAIELAASAFCDVTDRGGHPYILHCLRVMAAVNQDDPELMQIAVLHDLVEDTSYTIEELRYQGFSERVLAALDLLNHRKDVPYDDYIRAIATNKDAIAVKIADLKDNSNITRLKGLRKKDFDRIEKYHRAYVYLSE